jgi:hypothetical protein
MPPPDPELNKRLASASAPEHDQTAGPYGTVRATTGKGEEKETLTLNLKEEGRGDKGSVLTGEKVAAGGESRAIAVASGSCHAPRAAPAVASVSSLRRREEFFCSSRVDDFFPGLTEQGNPWWAGLNFVGA